MKNLLFFITLMISLFFSSCNSYKKQIPTGDPLVLKNVYTSPEYNYDPLVNVLLLPINNPLDNNEIKNYEKKLVLSTLRSFKKFHYFNIQYANDERLKKQGVINLQTEEINKAILGGLGEEYNAQAILQISIVDIEIHSPMRLAIQALLVDAHTGERIWQVEQVFDTTNANVYNGMRYWWNTHLAGANQFDRFEFDHLRPNIFFDYVFFTLAETYGSSRTRNIISISREYKKQEKLTND
jgi:hypothetical protein